ncbi:MAG TPA: hypothetical protein VGM88_25020 [Kofleriaceae bacterium]|jgi:hypothetical protein
MATRLAVVAALALAACDVASARKMGAVMTDYKIAATAAGASALFLGDGGGFVAEHRGWLAAAYRERADEAPGVVQLHGADGGVKRTVSGWALGGPVGVDMAWLEEVGSEYHYRVARGAGPGSELAPPDDFWAVAGTAGHASSPLAAAVLWRPAPGASVRDPYRRHDELWIASIDRRTAIVVKTRSLALTLPWNRTRAIAVGGPPNAPILVLAGVPDAEAGGQYHIVGLRLPTLETVWETNLDVAAADEGTTGREIRTSREIALAPLGDGSGWLFAYGGLVKGTLVVDQVHTISADGKIAAHPKLHLPGIASLGPIEAAGGALVVGEAGGSFAELDAVYPATDRIETLADRATVVGGKKLGDNPDLAPSAAALRGKTILVAPPVGGSGSGVDQADVAGKQTEPPAWHRADRPRVIARDKWLADRASAR